MLSTAPMPKPSINSSWPSAMTRTRRRRGCWSRRGGLSLLRQIHQLPELQREVVYLRAFGNLSFREIGDVLGKTENWARVTFYRSKEKLRNGGTEDEK